MLPGKTSRFIGVLGGAGGTGKGIDFARADEMDVRGVFCTRYAALPREVLGFAGVGEAVEVEEGGEGGWGSAEEALGAV